MSASTIARWNEISMTRDSAGPSNKRPRSDIEDDEDSSEDNVSLISRSPSPRPQEDVEMRDVNLYDEHVRGVAREVITVETKIKSSNKGFTLLAKMGWTEGTPLGISGEGRVDPIPFTIKQDLTGLGKNTQDIQMIETTVSQRRNLDSERMRFETAEQRRKRENAVAQKAAVQTEISSVLRPFYCELCDKQFKNVAQYDEHTNSYAHHHKARTKDMNANHPMKLGGKDEAEKRKEKERKREEKEMRKLAKAAGIKLGAPPAIPGASSSGASQPTDEEGKALKKSGWAAVSTAHAPPSTPAPTPGWATVSSPAPPAVPRTSSWQAVPPSAPPPPSPPAGAAPPVPPSATGFRSAGWQSTVSTDPSPSTSTLSDGQRSSWASVGSAPSAPRPPPPEYKIPPPPPGPTIAPPAPPPPSGGWSRTLAPAQNPAPPPPHASSEQARQSTQGPAPAGGAASPKPDPPAQSRGSWQQFQKMRGRR